MSYNVIVSLNDGPFETMPMFKPRKTIESARRFMEDFALGMLCAPDAPRAWIAYEDRGTIVLANERMHKISMEIVAEGPYLLPAVA